MPIDVREVVARRGDLGTFVVHLTRDRNGITARQAIEQALQTRRLEAGNPFGHALARLINNNLPTNSQRTVCFTETPLEYVYLLLHEIHGRDVALRPYGIAITKKVARRLGVNPVWYVDQTPGHPWIGNHLNALIDAAIQAGNFDASDIAGIAPFVEQMGTHRNAQGQYEYRKEFWWEREWRHRGHFDLPQRLIVLAPVADHAPLSATCQNAELTASFVDPAWGIERIIASLAGFPEADVEML